MAEPVRLQRFSDFETRHLKTVVQKKIDCTDIGFKVL